LRLHREAVRAGPDRPARERRPPPAVRDHRCRPGGAGRAAHHLVDGGRRRPPAAGAGVTRRPTRLVRLYPRAWRRRYGAGLEALLDEMPASPAVVLDVVRGAAGAHVRQRRSAAIWLVAAVATVIAEILSLRAGVTANLVWAPTDPERAL